MKYYPWEETLSYNKRDNLVISARSYGKTFGLRKQFLNDFRKRGWLFTEIVRTKEAIIPVAKKYFLKIQTAGIEPYNKWEFNYNFVERTMYARKPGFEEWEEIGYIVALSEEQFLKQLTFPNGNKVMRFLLDEAIIERKDKYHKYMPNEWETLNGVISTITRETPENPSPARRYYFGNAVDLTCPYFEYLGINKLPEDYGYHIYGNTLFHYVEPYAQEEYEAKTLTGSSLAGSSSGAKLFGNKFEADNQDFIKQKSKAAKFWKGFIYNGVSFGLWLDMKQALVFVTSKIPNNELTYTFTLEDDTINYTLIKRSSMIVRQLSEFFYGKLYRYETPMLREKFADMLLALNAI